jgi:hypothetical protein
MVAVPFRVAGLLAAGPEVGVLTCAKLIQAKARMHTRGNDRERRMGHLPLRHKTIGSGAMARPSFGMAMQDVSLPGA